MTPPLRDYGHARTTTGAYPLRLDDDYQTVVTITNLSEEKTHFGGSIYYSGEQYMLPLNELGPGQSAVFDIKKIIDGQIPDQNGKVIPANVKTGQFRWSQIKMGPTEARLIGRSEVVSRSNRVSISYSCPLCCPTSGPYPEQMPGFYAGIGEFSNYTYGGIYYDCYIGAMGPYPFQWLSLYSNNTSVGIVSQSGGWWESPMTLQGVGNGATTWYGEYYFQESTPVGDNECSSISYNGNSQGPMEVGPTVTLTVPETAMDGDTVEFSVSVQDGTPTNYEWSFEPTSGGNNPQVNFSNPTGATTTAKAHWFAKPDSPCGASFDSKYTIKMKVTFQGGRRITKEAPFTVSVDRNWGGTVDPPTTDARAGTLDIALDNQRGLWIVTGPGRFQRIPSSMRVRTPQTSQFYEKTVKHEEVHEKQYIGNGIFSDLYLIDNVMPRLYQLSDPNPQVLEQRAFETVRTWRGEQDQILLQRLPEAEREAHAVADPIAPRYLFQFECRPSGQ